MNRRCRELLKLLKWCAANWQHTFPKQKWLADQLGYSIRTIKRALSELRGYLVDVRRRYRRSNVYTLLEPAQMSFDFASLECSEAASESRTLTDDSSRKTEKTGTALRQPDRGDLRLTIADRQKPSEAIRKPPESTPIQQRVPKVGPIVVTSNTEPATEVLSVYSSRETRQHPSNEAVEKLLSLAGIKRKPSKSEREFVSSLKYTPEVIRGGVALGVARKMVQREDLRIPDWQKKPVRSLLYFADCIREAATFSLTYLRYIENWPNRHGAA